MQQQHYWSNYNPQPNYYSQPYDGAGPANGYTPYPQQSQLWPSAATPYISASTVPTSMPMHAAPVAGPSISRTQQQQQQRRATTLPSSKARPTKALRRSGTQQVPAPSAPAPLQRKTAISNHKAPLPQVLPPQVEKLRSAQNSKSMTEEDLHMFLSFHGQNELHIEHLPRAAMDEIRREIFGVWPDGIELDELKDYRWRVRLKNAPWSLSGPHVCSVWKMLVKLFVLFEERGYSFHASINNGSSSPRLVFLASDMYSTRFFLASFSGGGRFCLIDAPPPISQAFGMRIQSALGGLIASDEIVKEGMSTVQVVELKRHIYGGSQISGGYFLAKAFSILESLRYQLVASLPMARKGPLGMFGLGPKQELLVFRSMERAPIQ